MLRPFVLAVAMTLLSAPTISAATMIVVPQTNDTVIIPKNNSLHFRAFGKEHALEFDGAIELTGTWYYGDNQFNDSDGAEPLLYFAPDKASFARLPRFKERGQPGYIYLSNSMDMLKSITSNAQRAKVEKKGGKYLSGHIDIWVDKFEAGIECDAPYFNAHFLRVAQPPMRVALGEMPEEGC